MGEVEEREGRGSSVSLSSPLPGGGSGQGVEAAQGLRHWQPHNRMHSLSPASLNAAHNLSLPTRKSKSTTSLLLLAAAFKDVGQGRAIQRSGRLHVVDRTQEALGSEPGALREERTSQVSARCGWVAARACRDGSERDWTYLDGRGPVHAGEEVPATQRETSYISKEGRAK